MSRTSKYYTPKGYNEKSRANLAPQFEKGRSGATGPRGVWTPAEYMRHMQGDAWPAERLREIAGDPKAAAGKRAAAGQLLAMVPADGAEVREVTEARHTFESINNRLEGTPTQSHRVIDDSTPDPARVLEQLQASIVGAERVVPDPTPALAAGTCAVVSLPAGTAPAVLAAMDAAGVVYSVEAEIEPQPDAGA
jgi:hypothetical protein